MLTILPALLLLRQDTKPNAAEVVSRMIAHYQRLTSFQGTVTLTTTAGQQSGRLITTIAAKDPSYLLIRQQPEGIDANRLWMVLSDGNVFRYPLPGSQPGAGVGKILQEKVNQDGVILSFRDIFGVVAPGLKDRSVPISILFGRLPDLQTFRDQLASLEYQGKTTLAGQTCDVVGGGWRPYAKHKYAVDRSGRPIDQTVAPEDNYRITIGPNGELLRYEIFGNHIFTKYVDRQGREVGPSDPNAVAQSTGPLEIHETWDVNVVINGDVDLAQFRLI